MSLQNSPPKPLPPHPDLLPRPPSPTAPRETYTASCHCGAFTYIVTASPPLLDPRATLSSCNCSICTRNGSLMIYVPDDAVHFTKGTIEGFKAYTFGPAPKIAHYFCATCGSSCLARSVEAGFFDGMTCVNVRMLEDKRVWEGVRKRYVDGAAL
ncbi:Mss4-like protein [Paraphoma chrysanthemicola]|uniref:Mss4-like protein n=1 Tax=Paraphoma chrysanthemicola TaxID=798071 RepID=A0A8K0R7D4_9PLEO|nr:Mss4-like protein [Paraphoma chrysanthemicola]